MRRIIIGIIPALLYFIWFVFNVRALAGRHMEENIFIPMLVIGIVVIVLAVMLMIKITSKILKKETKKKVNNKIFIISVVYTVIGAVTLAIGYNTPCCMGG